MQKKLSKNLHKCRIFCTFVVEIIKITIKPYGNTVKPDDMTKQYIYRVVEVKANDIVWMSNGFCSTKENAYKCIEAQADNYKKLFGCTVEDYQGHKWDSVAVSECGKESWVTAEKVKTITDDRGYKKVFGFITYEIA